MGNETFYWDGLSSETGTVLKAVSVESRFEINKQIFPSNVLMTANQFCFKFVEVP